ncbi:MAG: class I tRNA ligase family protein, partial [Candidatus Magasanikiibacteriota bacterium]
PDWNISRNRFWATPLPFWKCDNKECDNQVCVGSVDELREKGDREITKVMFMRHGEANHEIEMVKSSDVNKHSLTEIGKEQIKTCAKNIKDKVDIIISSPVLRCRETAEILSKELKVDIVIDDLITEYNHGGWSEIKRDELEKMASFIEYKKITSLEEKFNYHLGENGESRKEITDRVDKFLKNINKKYSGKTVLIVSHGGVNASMSKILSDVNYEQYFLEEDISHEAPKYFYIDNNNKGLDLHKHNVDKIKLKCDKCGGTMTRIPEVIDCWVESASMPFAEWHYPFENVETFKKRFPGQYIAEYIAQTRAWFYYMHVMAVLLFDDVSFENVVCTGTILNDKGEKLSKSKMNYTDPWKIIDEFGVDALRYYLMTSVVMQAENLYFNDREVRDVYNKVMNILDNVLSFYGMYHTEGTELKDYTDSENVLDKWILAKLNVLVGEVTEHMDKYDTVRAGRPIKDFIDELSTWYLRRSRDRFKDENETDKQFALATLRQVLETLSKLMAPFTPFIAEKVWYTVTGSKESVHLQEWPVVDEKMIDKKVLGDMELVRKIVELALALRAETGLKVRQPINNLEVASTVLGSDFGLQLKMMVLSEVNVNTNILSLTNKVTQREGYVYKESGGLSVGIDTNITPELKKLGLLREVVRTINQIRKEQKMTIEDRVVVEYSTDDQLLNSVFVDFAEELKKSVLATELKVGETGVEVEIDGKKIKLKVS